MIFEPPTELQLDQATRFASSKFEIIDKIRVANLKDPESGTYVIRIDTYKKTNESLRRKYEIHYENFKSISITSL